MIRIFRHYINAKVMLQMAFDFGFVLLALLLVTFAVAGDGVQTASRLKSGAFARCSPTGRVAGLPPSACGLQGRRQAGPEPLPASSRGGALRAARA